MKKALVISGGGSKGAFAGGIAEYLIKQCKKDYDLYVGTSTGSLLIPFLALGQIEKIKKLYTTIHQGDIFDVCPFIIKKENGIFKTRINHLGILKQFATNQKTLGSSKNLRTLIQTNFLEEDYLQLKKLGKEVIVTVANLTKQVVEYKSSNNYSYDDFCDWIWASSNMVPLMSLFTKDNEDFADGGFGNLIPIQEAIAQGATFVDAIVLRMENRIYNSAPIHNALEALNHTYNFMLNQIAQDDIIIARMEALNHKTDVQFYYIDQILTDQSYIFDAEQMKNWWERGFQLFQNKPPDTHAVNMSKP
ncbi:MAG: patatin-like phospholipase family protein [Bacteroidia bacterium]